MLPELVERAPPGTIGHCSDNGWSSEGPFFYFLKHFYLHGKPSKESPTLLIIDNHKTRITLLAILYCRKKNIIMVGLPPHISHHLQPLDVSFFGPLKTNYSLACGNFMVTHPGQTITDKNIRELLSNT
ncbi:DDE-1 domain-containing protein [Trichonephila clavipes]|nr:DDE-1 domain-containing protein [Trichonephila clavipes]